MGLERDFDCLGEGWEQLFSELSFGSGVLPLSRYVSSLSVAWGRVALPSFTDPSDPSTGHDSPLPGKKTDSLKHKAMLSRAGTFLRGNSKPLSRALSFSLQLVSQGGGQLGGSHIEKLGGAWGTLWPWLKSQA